MPLVRPPTPDPNYFEAFLAFTPSGPSSAPGSSSEYYIIFDAVLSEDWTEDATITEHPVEQGANVADHIRVALVKCTLKVRVSNEPLDSNTFVDPIGGAGETAPLTLDLRGDQPPPAQQPGPAEVIVPAWKNNLEVAASLGLAAAAAVALSGAAAQAVGDVPLGNLTAASLKPGVETTPTGNRVVDYPDASPLVTGAAAAATRILGDAVSALGTEGVTSIVPQGEEIDLAVPVVAGLAPAVLPAQVTAQTVQFAGRNDYATLMIELLTGLKDSAQLFLLVGSKQTLSSMAIESLAVHRGAPEDTGTGAEITIGLKQVRVVSTNTVAAAIPKIPRGTPPANGGAQDSTPASNADSEDLIYWLVDGLISGLVERFSGGGGSS